MGTNKQPAAPLLSSGDVCEIAGLDAHTFDEWCAKGVVTPAEGGEGRGDHRKWTKMQTVGLAVGIAVRGGERSCRLKYIGAVVDAFGAMPKKVSP